MAFGAAHTTKPSDFGFHSMNKWFQRRGADALVVLSFDSGRLHATVARKVGESLPGGPSVALSFSVSLETGDPETLAQELRQQLEGAGIRERACVVSLPPEWIFTRLTALPDLSEEDRRSFLELDAERGFPFAPEELVLTRCYFGSGIRAQALQLAVLRSKVERLDSWLRRARLNPLSFSVSGLAWARAAANRSPGSIRLWIQPESAVLIVDSVSGLAAVRYLGSEARVSGDTPRWQPEKLAREIRVTLGQLAPELRSEVHSFAVIGNEVEARTLAEELAPLLIAFGLKPEATGRTPGCHPVSPASMARSVATQLWSGADTSIEFLPPRISNWQKVTSRYSARKLAYIGGAVGGLAAIAVIAIGLQEYQLHRLKSQWSTMSARVHDLEQTEQNIRKYRPWYDNSVRTLRILRRLTEAFPEDGSVTAKTLEIHDPGVVNCSGTARDQTALLKLLDSLRSSKDVTEVQVDQLRGKSPLQFSFNLHWEGASQP